MIQIERENIKSSSSFRLIRVVIFIYLSFNLVGCSKDCESQSTTCSETPLTGEDCLAFFQRWFYNKETNTCERVGYSGCSLKGFDTEEECKECAC